MLGRLVGEHIALEWRPGPALWKVKIDPSQVDQVLANLTVNARDAVGKREGSRSRPPTRSSMKGVPRTAGAGPRRLCPTEGERRRLRHGQGDADNIFERFSPPRRKAWGRVSGWRRCTASSSRTAASSTSTANRGAERRSGSTCPATRTGAPAPRPRAGGGPGGRHGDDPGRRGRAERAGAHPSHARTAGLQGPRVLRQGRGAAVGPGARRRPSTCCSPTWSCRKWTGRSSRTGYSPCSRL
jgi:hypothetical protein